MLDPEHVAWTKADLEHRPKPLPSLAAPPPLKDEEEAPATISHGRHDTPGPPEEPTFVPERPFVINDPHDILDALDSLTNHGTKDLSAAEQRAVRQLWSKDFTAALFKKIKNTEKNGPFYTTDLEEYLPSLVRAFPENERCQIYGHWYRQRNASYGCLPRELARLQMLTIQADAVKYPTIQGHMLMNGSQTHKIVDANTMIHLLDAQLNNKPLPDWFVKARDEARKNQNNPDYPHEGNVPTTPSPTPNP